MASWNWWFTVHDDILLGFATSRFPKTSKAVQDVRPAKEKGYLELIFEQNEKKTVPLEAYKTVESGFRSLKDIASRRKFCDELNAVLAKLKIAFADDVSHLDSSGELFTPADCILQTDSELDSTVEESPASSASSQDASTSRKYVHKELEEEVKIMRDAHPQSGKVGRREFLKTGDVAWRRKCEVLLAFRPKVHAGTFGGSFREQIYLSTLPECCFEELQGIFAAFKRGDIPTMRNTKSIKPGLFALLVGEKREVEVHHHLSNLANGLVSLDQFRKDISSLKKTRSNEESMQEIKRENRRLRDENAKLKDQLEEMRQKFGSGQNEMDPFTFDEAGEEVQEEEENPMSTLETQQTRGLKKDNRRKETAVQRKESELQNAWVVLERIQEEDISTQSVVTFTRGDAVEAFYSPEKTWYRASVLGKRKNPEGYRVRYTMDNFVEVVKPAHVRKIAA